MESFSVSAGEKSIGQPSGFTIAEAKDSAAAGALPFDSAYFDKMHVFAAV
jgi:hypothetical protein